MHCPVMTEKHVADRWQVSLKTLRRWRLDGEGPVWHKLFRHVCYHEADIQMASCLVGSAAAAVGDEAELTRPAHTADPHCRLQRPARQRNGVRRGG